MTLLRSTSLARRGLAPLLLVGATLAPMALVAACSSDEGGCTKDSECATGRLCEAGTCVNAPTSSVTTGATTGGGAGATTGSGGAGGMGASTASGTATGTTTTSTSASTGSGMSDPAAASCKALLTAKPGTPNGVYPIDPDGAGPQPETQLFCDMTNGGLTLVANIYDSAGDDAPNSTDYVVSGWQQKASGQWETTAKKVDRDATGNGSAAVSLAFVAALKASAGQQNLKMCFVSNAGADSVCRGSADGSLTLKSYSVGNSKLLQFSGDVLTYSFGRIAGLAGSNDTYDYATYEYQAYCIPRLEGAKYEFGVGYSNHGFCDHWKRPEDSGSGCKAYGVWHGIDDGMSYRPSLVNNNELGGTACNMNGENPDPNPNTYGFRLYVGP
jgi:hypothetical protein